MSFLTILLVLICIGVLMGGISWVAAAKRSSDFEPEKEKLLQELDTVSQKIFQRSIPVLAKKQLQIIYFDDYGVKCGHEEWRKEFDYFFDTVLLQNPEYIAASSNLHSGLIGAGRIEYYHPDKDALWRSVNDLIEVYIEENGLSLPVRQMSGVEFEVLCAEALSADGWNVVRKGGSGDQGVDLVATLGGLRVAVQCKRYSQAVGNTAVQEVAAGRQFEQCNLAVVVTNAEYTPAARQLANALGVQLLHYSDMIGFRDRVTSQFPALVSDREGRS